MTERLRRAAAASALAGLLAVPCRAQDGPSPMREALADLAAPRGPAEELRRYEALANVPVRDVGDLRALHEAAEKRESSVPADASDAQLQDYWHKSEQLSMRLRTCTDEGLKKGVARLLAAEAKNLRLPFSGAPLPPRSEQLRLSLRKDRVFSLIYAAGQARNAGAREALWDVIDADQGGTLAENAVLALGRIGRSADLDDLIKKIEAEPGLKFSLRNFGAKLVPRVLSELEDSSLAPEARQALTGQIAQVRDRESLSRLLPLMSGDDEPVAEAARAAVGGILRARDADLIRDLFINPSAKIRRTAAVAVGATAWSESYATLLIGMLKNDPSADNRLIAARCLGVYRIKAAVPALRRALKHPDERVAAAAQRALDRIDGKPVRDDEPPR